MKKSLLYSFIVVSIWFLIVAQNLYTSFFTQSMMGIILLYTYLSYVIGKRTHWSYGAGVFYFTVLQIPQLIFTGKLNPSFNDQAILTFQAIIGQGLIYFTLVALFFTFFKNVKLLLNLLFIAASLNSHIIIMKYFFGQAPWFLFNNPAIDASFIACLIPFALRIHYSLALPMIMACLLTDSSSGIIGPIIALSAYYLNNKKILVALFASSTILSFGILSQGYEKILNSSGRFQVWKLGMDHFFNNVNHWLGAGTGTWAVYGPTLQVQEAMRRGVVHVDGFFWMHNDWLQILFENGILGLLITILIFIKTLHTHFNNPKIRAALITLATIAIIQMPLRHIVFTVFSGALLFYPKKKYG